MKKHKIINLLEHLEHLDQDACTLQRHIKLVQDLIRTTQDLGLILIFLYLPALNMLMETNLSKYPGRQRERTNLKKIISIHIR